MQKHRNLSSKTSEWKLWEYGLEIGTENLALVLDRVDESGEKQDS